jgi:hypothetical protein
VTEQVAVAEALPEPWLTPGVRDIGLAHLLADLGERTATLLRDRRASVP